MCFRVRAICLGLKSDWAYSDSLRVPPVLVPTQHFHLEYENPFDQNGILYWIGTKGNAREYVNPLSSGEINVTLSCKWYGTDVAKFVEHNPLSLVFDPNCPCSWIEVDLGVDRRLLPTYYCLRGFEKMKFILRSWELQAKNAESESWTTLRRHHNDTKILPSVHPYPVGSWCLGNVTEFYRFFRIVQLDFDGSKSKTLPCGGMELYGILLQQEKSRKTREKNIPLSSY